MGGIRGVALASALLAGAGAQTTQRIYGADNIKRHLQRQKRDHGGGASGSLAGHGNGAREIARRLRQAERNAERRAERATTALMRFGRALVDPVGEHGLSRRGRWVPLSL